MAEHLGAEKAVHGALWAQMHGGYFSDPAVAQPLVEVVRDVQAESRPEVIVDLGGGTGFLLSQLRNAGMGETPALVNLDCSPAQLELSGGAGVSSVFGSVAGFRREEVAPAGCKALWLMRSVLHYAGENGLDPLLRHVRAQAEVGECWVHQTACFEREADAACLNALYRRLRTNKWYPTVVDLRKRLLAAGWAVQEDRPAPPLRLDSEELGLRYGLDEGEIRRIGKEMAKEFGGRNDVFRSTFAGFQAALRYRIFICAARTG